MSFQDQQVGKIGRKANDFSEYFKLGREKLNLQFEMSDEELLETYERYSKAFESKLNAFYQFRSLFAPIIEGLILLDRLAFLMEQVSIDRWLFFQCAFTKYVSIILLQESVGESHLVPLFDPVISPRCFALIAMKQS